ncbi:hypothetical protein Zm00014a_025896 [Zea mays]|uniref:Uncharacterized protein n=1 Tax=Zea mays TaxID=4577 RepID=A0A3L6E980_MAIZE|nr:hypothetical protein Zm00014a_025896 [Zea mays]
MAPSPIHGCLPSLTSQLDPFSAPFRGGDGWKLKKTSLCL